MTTEKNSTECTHGYSSSSFDKIDSLPRSEDLSSVSRPLGKIETENSFPERDQNRNSYISSLNGYYGFFRLGLSDLLEPLLISSGFILEKSSPLLIDPALAGKVPTLQQKIEAGIQTSDLPKAPEHATRACFFVPSCLWWLRRGTFMVAGNFWAGGLNPAWAATIEIQTSCGSEFNQKRLPV